MSRVRVQGPRGRPHTPGWWLRTPGPEDRRHAHTGTWRDGWRRSLNARRMSLRRARADRSRGRPRARSQRRRTERRGDRAGPGGARLRSIRAMLATRDRMTICLGNCPYRDAASGEPGGDLRAAQRRHARASRHPRPRRQARTLRAPGSGVGGLRDRAALTRGSLARAVPPRGLPNRCGEPGDHPKDSLACLETPVTNGSSTMTSGTRSDQGFLGRRQPGSSRACSARATPCRRIGRAGELHPGAVALLLVTFACQRPSVFSPTAAIFSPHPRP